MFYSIESNDQHFKDYREKAHECGYKGAAAINKTDLIYFAGTLTKAAAEQAWQAAVAAGFARCVDNVDLAHKLWLEDWVKGFEAYKKGHMECEGVTLYS